VNNPSPSAQHSLLLGAAHAVDIARFLRDDPALRLDYCSNVTGVDWPDKEIVETVKRTVPVEPLPAVAGVGLPAVALAKVGDPGPASPGPATEAVTKVIEEKTKRVVPGHLEVVYHLYSMTLKQGPVIIRLRTTNRNDQVTVPSLTPIWRACEFQEREVFDLYGVVFARHPDLRRILMWDEFKDHPMRKDYVEPDDYEWEPTAHGDVAEKAKRHAAREVTSDK
jgi:NADH-quinone oxidoreductase subunit C